MYASCLRQTPKQFLRLPGYRVPTKASITMRHIRFNISKAVQNAECHVTYCCCQLSFFVYIIRVLVVLFFFKVEKCILFLYLVLVLEMIFVFISVIAWKSITRFLLIVLCIVHGIVAARPFFKRTLLVGQWH